MRLRNLCVICAFVFFITLNKGDQGVVEKYHEDANEIIPGRTYYWKEWCFCQAPDYLYIWSESAILRFWMETVIGWFDFVTDGKSFTLYPDGELKNQTDHENVLEEVRSLINSSTHIQPILSHAGSTKLVVGNYWFLISREEGEISISHTHQEQVITLREDFPGLTAESKGENRTFLAKTTMGPEFSKSWITDGRETNQLRPKGGTLKPKTENQNENNPDNVLTEIQCNTNTRLHHISYTWNIDHIDLYRPEESNEHSIQSPTFSSSTNDKVKWYLSMKPRNIKSDHIAMFLLRSDESKESKILAKVTLSFFDNKQNLIETKHQKLHIYDTRGWGWGNILLSDVVSSDNKLRMVWNITFCESTNSVSCNNRTHTISNHKCNLTPDSVPPIENSDFPDIILVLSKTGKEYPANKTILSASSPVFAAMFNTSHTKKGEKIDRINITDIDSEPVFDELLKYIYTSDCENIEYLAHDLLDAAYKYELDDLKQLCVEKISKNLTLGNAVDTLNLADKHGFDELKSKTIRYIAANYAVISNTPDWKRIVETNSKFLHKVCQVLSNSNISDKELAEE